ncbi:hypothetical protein E3N88_13728 [Mikania micrantha]|uniref:Reverse transcriptase domain-containing protein n=1 Tax=Mikania micrantha TaxID=192012 RepID=A0A5N6P0L7_9ASTR|nr:hypothetical protein E3N88_13728 [Mikania micrantha]
MRDTFWLRQGCEGHFRRQCPRLNNNNATTSAFVIGATEACEEPAVTIGTFLVNNHYVSILFDTGADKSFISVAVASLFNVQPSILTTPYTVEVVDGKNILVNPILRGCKLMLNDHSFAIDLIPMTLSSFEVVIGMDWLSKDNVEVIFEKKPEKKTVKDVPVIRDYPEVFPEDLPGLPPV